MTITKVCSKCGQEKLFQRGTFVVAPNCPGGLSRVCRQCRSAYSKGWKIRHRDHVNERHRELYRERNGELQKEKRATWWRERPLRMRAEALRDGIWVRSRKLGWKIPAQLKSTAFFMRWLKSQPACECCGVPFELSPRDRQKSDASPSIDRFDPTQPYDLANISLVCWRCNNIKRNYCAADLIRVANWISGRASQKFEEAA